jgi:AcrR family transcriptional regulator
MSTSRQKKGGYHHGDLRAATLLAAGKLLEDQGPAGVVLREVARRAGVSHNAPYRHFPDREALLEALAAEGFERLGRRLSACAPADMGEAYVQFALMHPQRFRLMFGGVVPLGRDPTLAKASRQAYEALLQAFRGRSDIAEPGAAAAAAWSLVHGLAHLLLDGHFNEATQGGAQNAAFIRRVLATVRFAAAPQRSA